MMRRRAGLATSVTLAGCIAITCSACSVLRRTEAVTPSRPQPAAPVLQTRWAQLAYVRPATFAVCAEPACPKATPKTLASTGAAKALTLRVPATPSAPFANATQVTPPPQLPLLQPLPQRQPQSATRPLPVEPIDIDIVFSSHGGA